MKLRFTILGSFLGGAAGLNLFLIAGILFSWSAPLPKLMLIGFSAGALIGGAIGYSRANLHEPK